jgi:CTP:molybdopterin cytidylyltransferase MocA
MDGIVPAAGLATRMRGIPKFLLPCDRSYTTLLENHLRELLEVCDTIWIPTRPEMVLLLDSLGIAKERVVVLPIVTNNMTETVKRVLSIASADYFQLIMPDTFFLGETPYKKLAAQPKIADLACWTIRQEQKGKLGQVLADKDGIVIDMKDKDPGCEYPISWGSLTFSRRLEPYMKDSDPHIGYAVKHALEDGGTITAQTIEGQYFDCGTPDEYLSMLEKAL